MNNIKRTTCLTILALSTVFVADSYADGGTPLGEEMSAMNKPYRSITRAFKKTPDPAMNQDYIAWAESMLKHAMKSAEYLPSGIEKLGAEKQKEMTQAYQAAMAESIKTLEALIVALEAKDYAAASELLKSLKSQKSDGHDKFQEE